MFITDKQYYTDPSICILTPLISQVTDTTLVVVVTFLGVVVVVVVVVVMFLGVVGGLVVGSGAMVEGLTSL